MNDLAQQFQTELNLSNERAERTAELAEKLRSGNVSKVEFCELATTIFTRREMRANDAVQNYGVKPYFGLKHLGDDGKGPSINDLMRQTFATVNSKEDVIAAWDEAEDAGVVHVTDNIVAFNTGDITFTENGFDITPDHPERPGTAEPTDEDDEDEDGSIMSASEAVGL